MRSGMLAALDDLPDSKPLIELSIYKLVAHSACILLYYMPTGWWMAAV